MLAWIALAIALLVGGYILAGGTPLEGLGGGEIAYLVVGGALLATYLVAIAFDYRGRLMQALRYALIWCSIFFGVITAYAYRDVLTDVARRVGGELSAPGTIVDVETSPSGERSVRLRRRMGGQFSARSAVNGATLTLLVDTGASTVVLKPADAEKAGIDVSQLAYTVAVDTANGTTFAAPVRLRSIAIGPIEIRDVDALVAKPGNLKENLLGMTFLKRLRSYEFSGDYLTLRG
ncbi:MAG: retropepsin-like aspartic protease family protein [Hyphomicrobium sp.]